MVKNLDLPRQRLSNTKGALTTALRGMVELMEMIGDTPIHEDLGLIGLGKEENIGELLYTTQAVLVPLIRNLEVLNNYVRELDGLKPIDYSSADAAIWTQILMENVERQKERYDLEQSGDGSPA